MGGKELEIGADVLFMFDKGNAQRYSPAVDPGHRIGGPSGVRGAGK